MTKLRITPGPPPDTALQLDIKGRTAGVKLWERRRVHLTNTLYKYFGSKPLAQRSVSSLEKPKEMPPKDGLRLEIQKRGMEF